MSNEGNVDDDDHRRHLRPARHQRRGVQLRIQHAPLRPPHQAPARLRREFPPRPRPTQGMGKRDMVSNINWFMNVPVEADGALGIVDGISARENTSTCGPKWTRWSSSATARRSTIRATASTRRRCGRSSITAAVTFTRATRIHHVQQSSHRQSRRNCLPDHSHAGSNGHRLGGGLLRSRRPVHARRGRGRSRLHRPAPAAQSYLRGNLILEAAHQDRRAGHPPRLRLSQRKSRFRRRLRRSGHRLHRPHAAADAQLRPEAHRARIGRRPAACRFCQARLCSIRRATPRLAAGRIGFPVMLKSTAGGGGIGMRLCHGAEADWPTPSPPCSASAKTTSNMPDSTLKSTSSRPATSKCKSSATARATSSPLASAIAPPSAATRR